MSNGFGDIVQAARKGQMSRRGFLAAAIALGLGEREAEKELAPRVFVPKLRTARLLPFRDSLERIYQPFRDSLVGSVVYFDWSSNSHLDVNLFEATK